MEAGNFPYNFPVVIKNKINDWKILSFSNEDWCLEFKNTVLEFREGDNIYRQNPYWEESCNKKKLTLKQFFELSSHASDRWMYFDYKYMKDLFPETSSVCESINWADLGITDFKGVDSALWIGNKGAHTPCHFDSYGYNLVAQIYGRKLWILIAPEEIDVLNPTRVPYEESSVYSSLNFYTPNNELLKIRKAYKIVLSPGEVLFVPRHWWHYVENLEVAISVNLWVPLEADHESRLDESLVRQFISSISQTLPEEDVLKILNPNEYDFLAGANSLTIIQKCVENCQEFRKKHNTRSNKSNDTFKLCCNYYEPVPQCDLRSYVIEKSKNHHYDPSVIEKSLKLNHSLLFTQNLINAYCHPTNITAVKERLLSQLER
ncbi:hypothetical protein RUM43_008024 [Polyplax serrata]|uniref:JmjC domain-containing protein n=1 Tax=Polyplax serrata TaxID=468196 RepID=A0AAN8P6R8_POLSC